MSLPLPPGTPAQILARSALVLAPHYDDEVLGCGGLIAQVARRGVVRVLFLSDSAGGMEEIADRPAYASRRREESEAAAAVLGVAACEHLGLPDGALEQHLPALRDALRRALLSFRPELLLVPSPLEATPDHRAAFAALFGLLSPLRPGDELHAAVAGTTILAYEVNHPGYPDLLVDVSAELPLLEEAMGCYASQQERHDYLAAGVGLRRYRALSLPPEVTAAEGYRRLGLDDLTTRSASGLVRALGGAPELLAVTEGPLVSVVVRTCDRPALLAQALASLAASTYRQVELVLVNDGGASPAVPDGFPFPVRRIDLSPRQGRSAAANAGIAAATGAFVGFLDDDDLYEPEHLATLAGLVAGGVRIAYSDAAVGVYALDPATPGGWRQVERRLPYSRDFDADLLLVDNYIPLNTLLIDRELLREAGPLDPQLPFFEDWDLLIRLSRLAPFHHHRQATCEYRHFRGGGHILGERPRERPDFLAMKERVLQRHRALLDDATLARIVDTLRGEAVEAVEGMRAAQADARRAEEKRHGAEVAWLTVDRARLAAEEARHAAELRAQAHHGEAMALAGDLARLAEVAAFRDRELQRLFGVETELRAAIAEQDEHLRRCYAEIGRLNALLDGMRATRAWRLHEWLQRRRT